MNTLNPYLNYILFLSSLSLCACGGGSSEPGSVENEPLNTQSSPANSPNELIGNWIRGCHRLPSVGEVLDTSGEFRAFNVVRTLSIDDSVYASTQFFYAVGDIDCSIQIGENTLTANYMLTGGVTPVTIGGILPNPENATNVDLTRLSNNTLGQAVSNFPIEPGEIRQGMMIVHEDELYFQFSSDRPEDIFPSARYSRL